MAELAAVGLAGNIVQFVEFGTTLFHEGRELYRSAQGATADHLELENVTKDLERLALDLHSSQLEPSQSNENLRGFARDCGGLATQLLHLLEELKVTDTRNRKWGSFKRALAHVTKKGKVEELERRLTRFHQVLNRNLIVDLRYALQHSEMPC